jgi:hypothetical protein
MFGRFSSRFPLHNFFSGFIFLSFFFMNFYFRIVFAFEKGISTLNASKSSNQYSIGLDIKDIKEPLFISRTLHPNWIEAKEEFGLKVSLELIFQQ